jgi:hypothetical protein
MEQRRLFCKCARQLTVPRSYDNENRMREHRNGSTVTTYAYQYDGMKRPEAVGQS